MDTNTTESPPVAKADDWRLPPCVSERLKRLEDERKSILESVPAIESVEAALRGLDEEIRRVIKPWGAATVGVWVDLWVRSMEDVGAVRRALSRRGWKLQADGRADYPDDRRFTLCHQNNQVSGRLTVNVEFQQGSSCKYVQVGKKEVPVYELKCDGAES